MACAYNPGPVGGHAADRRIRMVDEGGGGADAGLAYTVSAWVYQLHAAGVTSQDVDVRAACEGIAAATDEQRGNAAGEALVARVGKLLAGATDAERVESLA